MHTYSIPELLAMLQHEVSGIDATRGVVDVECENRLLARR